MKCYLNLKNTIPTRCKVNAIGYEYKTMLRSKFDLHPLEKVRYSVPDYLTLALTPINTHKLNYQYTH